MRNMSYSNEDKQITFPKISIITVCYNSVKTIEQTIESVVNQSYGNIEYIIIDGGSIDGTDIIVEKYSNKIAYWISESDNGIYDAMNKGIRVATGDYIYFLGADDSLASKEIIATVASYIQLDRDIDVLSGCVYFIDEATNLQRKQNNKNAKLDVFSGIPHQGMFTKSDLLKSAEFDVRFKIVADYDFMLKCFLNKKSKIVFMDFVVAFNSLGGISSTSTGNRINEHLVVMKKYNASEERINRYLREEGILDDRSLKKYKLIIKSLLINWGFWVMAQKYRGWEVHRCEMPLCRWCKKR